MSLPVHLKYLHDAFNSYGANPLMVSTVFACIDRKSKDMAQLPLRPVKNTKSGYEIYKDSDLFFISQNPSPAFTHYTWQYACNAHIEEFGECFSPIMRKSGRPVAFGMWNPKDVEDKIIGGKLYWVNTQSKEAISDEDMIHVMDYTKNGIRGVSKITLAKNTIDLAVYGSKMASTLYKNQMWQPGYLSFAKDFTSEQADMISKTWGTKGGEQENYDIPVIDNGGEYKHFGVSLQASEYTPTMMNAALEICRFFGVPPSKVGISQGNVSYNSLEQENIAYVQDTILPRVIAWEEEMNRKCISEAEMGDVRFKFELKSRLRSDTAARSSFYQMALTTGLFSINEILKLEDMDTIGPEGDERYINAASVPLSKLFSGELDQNKSGNNGTDHADGVDQSDKEIKKLLAGVKLNGNGAYKVQ